MSRNRDLAAAFGVLLIAWGLLGGMGGFFANFPDYLKLSVWIIYVLILVFVPLVRGVARWTALGAGVVGIIGMIFLLIELATLNLNLITAAYGPGVGLIFAALFAFFAFRAYFEKPST